MEGPPYDSPIFLYKNVGFFGLKKNLPPPPRAEPPGLVNFLACPKKLTMWHRPINIPAAFFGKWDFPQHCFLENGIFCVKSNSQPMFFSGIAYLTVISMASQTLGIAWNCSWNWFLTAIPSISAFFLKKRRDLLVFFKKKAEKLGIAVKNQFQEQFQAIPRVCDAIEIAAKYAIPEKNLGVGIAFRFFLRVGCSRLFVFMVLEERSSGRPGGSHPAAAQSEIVQGVCLGFGIWAAAGLRVLMMAYSVPRARKIPF